jgi:hypothetical protein
MLVMLVIIAFHIDGIELVQTYQKARKQGHRESLRSL